MESLSENAAHKQDTNTAYRKEIQMYIITKSTNQVKKCQDSTKYNCLYKEKKWIKSL